MPLPNPRHELFAQSIAKGENASQAYVSAGFRPSRANACRLQQDERIQQRVADLLADRAKKDVRAAEKAVESLALSRKWVLSRLVINAEGALARHDGATANRALELIGKEQGMFIDRKETGAPGDFASMQNAGEVLDLVRKELGDETADALAAVFAKKEAEEVAEQPADPPEIDAGRSAEDRLN